jgi:hypothetical protein
MILLNGSSDQTKVSHYILFFEIGPAKEIIFKYNVLIYVYSKRVTPHDLLAYKFLVFTV